MSGLSESVTGEWSGDVNLHGAAVKQHEEYKRRIEFVSGIGLENRKEDAIIKCDLESIKQQITVDIKFATLSKIMYIIKYFLLPYMHIVHNSVTINFIIALQKVNKEYQDKQKEGKNRKEMLGLAWDVKELSDLNESGRQILVDCSTLVDKLVDPDYDRIASNLPLKLDELRKKLKSFRSRLTKYRRTAATHVLVVLISPEERVSKPYALAVQCLTYRSIKDTEMRQICNNIVNKMVARGMKVAG